ncbi:MAG: hypothetical protein ACTSWI_00415, partial [Alphaproteobacteria bacterium]
NIGSIGAFAGNLGAGNVTGDISIDVDLGRVADAVDQVRANLAQLSAAGVDTVVIADRLAAIEKELSSKTPNRGKIRSLLSGVRDAATAAAGNLTAVGVISLLNSILGTGV